MKCFLKVLYMNVHIWPLDNQNPANVLRDPNPSDKIGGGTWY